MAVPNDKGVIAIFKNGFVKNQIRSAEAGRPIFDDVEIVEIRHPGSRDYGVYPATERSHWIIDEVTGEQTAVSFAERFSKQYQQFKAHQQQTKSGTPIDYLPFLTEGKRAELRALNIYTAEQLALIDGADLRNLGPGGREWKNKAAEYLETSNDASKVTKLEAELEALKARNQVLEDDAKVLSEDKPAGEFEGMSNEQLREHIQSLTGVAPKGNLPRRTLLRMAIDQKGVVAA